MRSMPKNIFHFWGKTTFKTAILCVEILAVLTGVFVLAGGLLIWRLTTSSIDLGYAEKYVQDAVALETNGLYTLDVGDTLLTWPDIKKPLMLVMQDVQITKDGQSVLKVEQARIGILARYLLLGRVEPVSVAVIEPAIEVLRLKDERIVLSLKDAERQPVPDITSGSAESLSKILSPILDGKTPFIHKLRRIRVENAMVSVNDHLLNKHWEIDGVDIRILRKRDGLSAFIDIDSADRDAVIKSEITYKGIGDDLSVNTSFDHVNLSMFGDQHEALSVLKTFDVPLRGTVKALVRDDFSIAFIEGGLQSSEGSFLLEDVYENPLPYEGLEVLVRYDNEDDNGEEINTVTVQRASASVGGIAFLIESRFDFNAQGATIPVSLTIPNLEQSFIDGAWPASLRGEGAEDWLVHKLSGGTFKNTSVSLDVVLEKNEKKNEEKADGEEKERDWTVSAENIAVSTDIENMNIDYRAPLMPVENAFGRAEVKDNVLTIDVDRAKIGENIQVQNGHATLQNVMGVAGDTNIDVKLKGNLPSIFAYVAREPIAMDDESLGISADKISGQADLDVTISFPAKRDLLAEEVKVSVDGKVVGLSMPDIIETADLTQGNVSMKASGGKVVMDGKGKLSGRDVTFKWEKNLEPAKGDFAMRVTANVSSDRVLREELGVGLEDWVRGVVPVDVVFTEDAQENATADVRANIKMAELLFDPFYYSKPPGQDGTVSCTVIIKKGEIKEVDNLNIKTDKLHVEKGRLIFAQRKGESYMRRGEIPVFKLDETNISISIEEESKDNLKISIGGTFLDARPFLGDNKKQPPQTNADDPAVIVFIDVKRMRTHPARMIEQAKAYLDLDPKGQINQLELDAVAGQGDLYLRFKPTGPNRWSLRFEADDAGAALQAFDVYENMKGGKLVIAGESKSLEEPRVIRGNAQISNFKITNAPVLARIINVISPTGIQQLLKNDGIGFERLESGFDWHIRPEGDLYVIDGGKTSGSSIGLTFDGRINKKTDKIDVAGTIVPVSMINRLVSNIPLVGDILAGGKDGAVLAATYSVKGPASEPVVSVNPLAALAPGILRKILFEDNNKPSSKEE